MEAAAEAGAAAIEGLAEAVARANLGAAVAAKAAAWIAEVRGYACTHVYVYPNAMTRMHAHSHSHTHTHTHMHTQVLGAHSVSKLETEDIEGVPSFDARLGAVLMHTKLSVLQSYRRTRSVRFAALIRDACGPPVFVGPCTSAAHSPVGWRRARRQPQAAQGPRTRAQARARGGCGGTSRPTPSAPHRVEWLSEPVGVRWPPPTSAAGFGTASNPPWAYSAAVPAQQRRR